MGSLTEFIAEHGHAYIWRKRNISLRMFTTELSVASALKATYGGNYYISRMGYAWVLSKKPDLLRVYDEVRPLLSETSSLHIIEKIRPITYNKKPPP